MALLRGEEGCGEGNGLVSAGSRPAPVVAPTPWPTLARTAAPHFPQNFRPTPTSAPQLGQNMGYLHQSVQRTALPSLDIVISPPAAMELKPNPRSQKPVPATD